MRKIVVTESSIGGWMETDVSGTLRSSCGSYGGGSENLVFDDVGYGNYKLSNGIAITVSQRDYKDATDICVSGVNKTIRRLTPVECERLQGFQDNYTLIGEPVENKKTGEIEYWYVDSTGKRKRVTDSARYKALGNSIATPFWKYLAKRICAQYERDITIGSLFDGIGGFPYVFEKCGAKAVWASEIEEFPIAVTKEHYPE